MVKIKVYSKYMYLIYLGIGITCLLFGIYFSIDSINQRFVPHVLSYSLFFLMAIVFTYYSGYLNQDLVIYENHIVLKNVFYEMIKIKKSEITDIENHLLPTYQSWVSTLNEKYICIYSESCEIRFTKGGSNNRKLKRIQVVFSEKNYSIIKEKLG